MATETERKFLVDSEKLSKINLSDGEKIFQGYLSNEKNCTVRIRLKKNRGFLTVKGATVGISRKEFEYEIPADDAEEILQLCGTKIIKKTRYKFEFAGKVWEIDFFEDRHEGLILAEVELETADEIIDLPDWIKEEVSRDPRYFNSNLCKNCEVNFL